MSRTRFSVFFLLAAFAAVPAGAQALGGRPLLGGYAYDTQVKGPDGREWDDPTRVALNKLQPHAWFFSFKNAEEATGVLPEKSSFWKSLNGQWQFCWVGNPDERPLGFYATDYKMGEDRHEWNNVEVPMNWPVAGLQPDGTQKWGMPIYSNQRVIFQHQVKVDDWKEGVMREPAKDWLTYKNRNEVGSYRRTFTVPEEWDGREVYLDFDGVDSFFYLYINGRYVGFSKNSRSTASFDITPYLVSGENVVACEVYRQSDGSFLESQDMFRLPGIFRTVALHSKPRLQVADLVAVASSPTDLKVSSIVQNLGKKAVKGARISYSLYEKELYGEAVKAVPCTVSGAQGIDVQTDATQSVTLSCPQAKPWSAEAPHRYVLVAELEDAAGGVVETVSTIVGFRTCEIRETAAKDDEFGLAGRYYYLNGKPVKMKGVNRHENSPERGHAITREQMEKEVMLLKRGNINHVRNCHYPDDPYWYYLCDKYGIMLEDEANIESHEYYYGKESLSWVPEFRDQHVARNMEMVHQHVNHPSICIWSLGNEAGPGDNFVEAYKAIKAFDASRPVQYERNNSIVDMGSNQYPSIAWVQAAVTGKEEGLVYPFHISEYAHSMGNAVGNLVDYWNAIESTNFFVGGALWDWVDQAINNYTPDGTKYWGYGGDFGDKPNDGMFCMNGIMRPDLSPKAQYFEVKKVYQNVAVRPVDMKAGKVEIFNKNYFVDLSDYKVVWSLYEDGVQVAVNSLGAGCQPVGPRQRSVVTLDYGDYRFDPSKEYFVKVQFVQAADRPWAKAGYVQMEEQLLLQEPAAAPAIAGQVSASLAASGAGKAALRVRKPVVTPGSIAFSGEGWEVAFDTSRGNISMLKYGGENIFNAGEGPVLHAFRARTDNDNWCDYKWPQLGLHHLQHRALSFSHYARNDGAYVLNFTVESQAPYGGNDRYSNRDRNPESVYCIMENTRQRFGDDDFKFLTNQVYTVYPDGSVELEAAITANDDNVDLPRIGYAMQLPTEYDNFLYYGRGPVNNYNDRRTSQFVEIHEGRVGGQDIMLPKPQEMGNREEVRWCALTDQFGHGAAFVATTPSYAHVEDSGDLLFGKPSTAPGVAAMSVSALPWSQLELMEAAHPYQLPPSSATHLLLDAKVMGLGGNSCGQGGPLNPDRVKSTGYDFGFIIRPFALSKEAENLAEQAEDLGRVLKVSASGDRPLSIRRDARGNLTIHSLDEGRRLMYSVDGGKAKVYTSPVPFRQGGEVRAWYADNRRVVFSQRFPKVESVPLEVAFCSSQEFGEGNATHLVDGDLGTIWHTMYSVTVAQYPHWVDFDALDVKLMKGFVYTPRRNGDNGNVKDYEIYVSTDGQSWGEAVKKGTFAHDGKPQRVEFAAPVRARYIRFKALSSQNGQDFASGAEFSLIAE